MNIEMIEKEYIRMGMIDEDKQWILLKHQTTGVLYLLKKLTRYDIQVYACLKTHPHPNVVTIKDYYEVEGELWAIEEYIQGKTLEKMLEEKGSISEIETLSMISNICLALMHLHSLPNPVIHRDIKLANIMMDTYGHVIVVDFDVSRFYKQEKNGDTTILGTEGYAAPEQFGFTQTDARSDIYSLGVVMNYLLTGMHPKEFMYEGLSGKMIKKCTSFDPNKRYETVAMLYHDIDKSMRLIKVKPKPFWLVPGFRTKIKWKMAVAVMGYAIILNTIFTRNSRYTNEVMIWIDTILSGAMFFSLVFLYTNYMSIRSHLHFFNSSNIVNRVWGYIVYTLIICFGFGFGTVVFSNIFK
jgi:serine/threonine protein kinase